MSEEMDSPESWEFSRLPFASKILFVTLMCCFCSVPLNHSSVEECASFSVLSQSVNLQSVPHVCVGIREGCGCQEDVNVMIRVRDRVCKLGICNYYQVERKPKGPMFHFPWLGSC